MGGTGRSTWRKRGRHRWSNYDSPLLLSTSKNTRTLKLSGRFWATSPRLLFPGFFMNFCGNGSAPYALSDRLKYHGFVFGVKLTQDQR